MGKGGKSHGDVAEVKDAAEEENIAAWFVNINSLKILPFKLPALVLNVVTGYGTSGAAISSHMDIDQVNFTGPTEVGRLIMQATTQSNLKKVSLELRGKSLIIIFNDADVDKAAELAFLGAVVNKEEICGLATGIVTDTANTVSRSIRPGVI